jgi:disulfide bond formation protein DsbB
MKQQFNSLFNLMKQNALVIIFFLTFAASVGSLYYSEIEQIAPCPLCWWQRVFIYPIFMIATVALLTKDTKVFKYILTLAIPGFLFSLYHTLLQTTQLFGTSTSCGIGGISCAKIDIAWNILGVNIPMPGLALATLSIVIILCLIKLFKKN